MSWVRVPCHSLNHREGIAALLSMLPRQTHSIQKCALFDYFPEVLGILLCLIRKKMFTLG